MLHMCGQASQGEERWLVRLRGGVRRGAEGSRLAQGPTGGVLCGRGPSQGWLLGAIYGCSYWLSSCCMAYSEQMQCAPIHAGEGQLTAQDRLVTHAGTIFNAPPPCVLLFPAHSGHGDCDGMSCICEPGWTLFPDCSGRKFFFCTHALHCHVIARMAKHICFLHRVLP